MEHRSKQQSGPSGKPPRRGPGQDNRAPRHDRSDNAGSGVGELERQLHDWLDLLVWVWRRRTQDAGARFVQGARLGDNEIHTLAQGVKTLSRGLTGDRSLAATSYMEDPALLGAYLLFYWPLSWAQTWTVLKDPGLKLRGFAVEGAALDIGSGPGPVAFALLDCGARHVLALDSSPKALDLARDIADARKQIQTGSRGTEVRNYGTLETRVWNSRGPLPGGGADFTIAAYGHVLNELPDLAARLELERSVAAALAPEGVQLAIEPALRTTTRDLLTFRDSLLVPSGSGGSGARILGPCFYQKPCPVLHTPDQTCHGAVHWQVPGLVQRLAHAARLGKEEVSMAWLAWSRQPAGGLGAEPPAKGVAHDFPVRSQGEGLPPTGALESNLYRVTGEPMLNKAGFTRLMVCGGTDAGEGREGRMTLRMKREDLDAGGGVRKAGRVFFGLKRGDVIRLEHPALRDSGLGISEDSKLERL